MRGEKQALPPGAVIPVNEAVEKASHAHYCCQEEHLRVVAQPSKIDSDLLSIVFPEETQKLFLEDTNNHSAASSEY